MQVATAGNIYISRVCHKTYISVGEKGAKAGAYAFVEMATVGISGKQIYLDRLCVYARGLREQYPFLYRHTNGCKLTFLH